MPKEKDFGLNRYSIVACFLLGTLGLAMFSSAFITSASASEITLSDIDRPHVYQIGELEKPLLANESWKYVEDADNLGGSLVSDYNSSVDFLDVKPDQQFEKLNLSADVELDTGSFDIYRGMLDDSDDIGYFLFKMTNNTALANGTTYGLRFINDLNVEVDNSYHVSTLGTLDAINGDSSISRYRMDYFYMFVDSNGNEKSIDMIFKSDVSGITVTSDSSGIDVEANKTEYPALQFEIQHLLDKEGLAWEFDHLSQVQYKIQFKTDDTVNDVSSYEVAGKFRNHRVIGSPFKIASEPVNGTSFTKDQSNFETLDSSGQEVSKLANVDYKYKYDVPYQNPIEDDDRQVLKVDHNVKFPDGSAITWSTKQVNISQGGLTPANFSKFTWEGTDEWDSLKTDTLLGSWEFKTGLSAGTEYTATINLDIDDVDIYTKLDDIYTSGQESWLKKNIIDPVLGFSSWVVGHVGAVIALLTGGAVSLGGAKKAIDKWKA